MIIKTVELGNKYIGLINSVPTKKLIKKLRKLNHVEYTVLYTITVHGDGVVTFVAGSNGSCKKANKLFNAIGNKNLSTAWFERKEFLELLNSLYDM